MGYVTVAQGVRRTFTITTGLKAGYGGGGVLHHPQTANAVVGKWLEARASSGHLTVSGFFTEINLHYVYAEVQSPRAYFEPGLRFWGEVSIRRLGQAPDEEIKEVLNSLADTIGSALGQEHIQVSYRDEAWIREFRPN